MGTLLLDLRPEAGYTFDPFGSTSLLPKVYVSVKGVFVRFSVQVECTWASKDAQVGFVTERWTGVDKVPRTQTVTKHVCCVHVRANI